MDFEFNVNNRIHPVNRYNFLPLVEPLQGSPANKIPISPNMKPGRNDPCPCGSGKKYKHCCLNAGAADGSSVQPVDLVWRKIRNLLDGHVEKILRFVHESYGIEAIHEAWPDFIGKEEIAIDFEAPLMQLPFRAWPAG